MYVPMSCITCSSMFHRFALLCHLCLIDVHVVGLFCLMTCMSCSLLFMCWSFDFHMCIMCVICVSHIFICMSYVCRRLVNVVHDLFIDVSLMFITCGWFLQ